MCILFKYCMFSQVFLLFIVCVWQKESLCVCVCVYVYWHLHPHLKTLEKQSTLLRCWMQPLALSDGWFSWRWIVDLIRWNLWLKLVSTPVILKPKAGKKPRLSQKGVVQNFFYPYLFVLSTLQFPYISISQMYSYIHLLESVFTCRVLYAGCYQRW